MMYGFMARSDARLDSAEAQDSLDVAQRDYLKEQFGPARDRMVDATACAGPGATA